MVKPTIEMEVILHTIIDSGPRLVIGTITKSTLYSILQNFIHENVDDNYYNDGMLEFRLSDESKIEEVRLLPRYYDATLNSMITDDGIDITELVSNRDIENVLMYYKSHRDTQKHTIATMYIGYCMSTYYQNPFINTIKETDYSQCTIEAKKEPSDEYKKAVKEANKKIKASLYEQDRLWRKYGNNGG